MKVVAVFLASTLLTLGALAMILKPAEFVQPQGSVIATKENSTQSIEAAAGIAGTALVIAVLVPVIGLLKMMFI